MTVALRAQVTDLLDLALGRYDGRPGADDLRAARVRLHAPLRVAVAGKVKAGKSTLLNALVGEPLAPTDAGECTRVVTWYEHGSHYRVTVHPVDGPTTSVPFRRGEHALHVDLDGYELDEVDRLTVAWPATALQALTLIDTPGIASQSATLSARTHALLTPERGVTQADAVCYLMRHLHAADEQFLEAFGDDDVASVGPMHAIGVLSRTDEIGGGRLSALEAGARIADRYRTDPQMRRLCQTVVPVAGLLAETAATLREDEYAALAALVAVDRAVLDPLLLSADRFGGDADIDVDADARRALLARLGLFGVRLCMALIRGGQAPNAARLAAALRHRSGIDGLRETLATRFAARTDLLKARAALSALTDVLRTAPRDDVDDVAAGIERIVAGTHAFAEARLLDALRAGTVDVDDAAAHDAERLLGGHGTTPAHRLGLTAPERRPMRPCRTSTKFAAPRSPR